jgi:transposase InsO family protein
VEKISEHYLLPVLEYCLNQFPFRIINFHSDNGSEFINYMVANLLNKLLISQTKSRARHCNDNALIESKNGSIIRKHIGYYFVPKHYAKDLNIFFKKYFNVYLNYHRPCGYATIFTDKKGKEKKKYNIYQTPYERLKSLKNAEQYLKSGINFKILDKIAYQFSDNEFAEIMEKEKVCLFKKFKNKSHKFQFPMFFTTLISGSYVN